MKEIIRWHLTTPLTDNPRTLGEIKRDDNGEYVLYLEHKEQVEQLQARIKELESEQHIWSIRNEARLLMIGHIVDDLENETDINKVKEYLEWQLNYYQKKVDNNE